MGIESLYAEARRVNVEIREHRFKGTRLKALYSDGYITLNTTYPATLKEKNCILAEELGHYHTSTGNILDQSKLSNRKQERRARGWGYDFLIDLEGIVEAFLAGVNGRHEIAEFLDVTEEYLDNSLIWYQEKYGLFALIDEYMIFFDPLSVAVMIE